MNNLGRKQIKAHKNNTKTFDEESYAEQAKSINAEMRNLEKAIKANIRRAIKDKRENPKDKRIKNLQDMIERINKY
jgi:phage host-nuclease inhibitor protein Gam